MAFLLAAALPVLGQEPPPALPVEDTRLRVLLLDYHEPIEHDVLLSHLCAEPCTAERGCPAHLLEQGVAYFNADLAIWRPPYLGENGAYLVELFGDKKLDLISFSGHHSSGFSGTYGKGRFQTEGLLGVVPELPDWQRFFTTPSMVLLQGCWTDVKSEFDKDPIEYIRHVIEDTEVRPGESERLVAAVNQMAAGKQAYRELFPNACLLGYDGSQVPGGLLEIYGQVHGSLRGLAQRMGQPVAGWRIPMERARAEADALVARVDNECGAAGWPCNLCRRDNGVYGPLARGLVAFLRAERRRLDEGEARVPSVALDLEGRLEASSYYRNASWSCSATPVDTPPVLPPPIDRAPYAPLFLELLTTPKLGNVEPDVRLSLDAEIVLFLGGLKLDDAIRATLREQLESEASAEWLGRFVPALAAISSARQRAFFDFLAEVGCASCFAAVPTDDAAWIQRENAAARYRSTLGRELFLTYLGDPVPRVRRAALSRADPWRERDLLLLAAQKDPDPGARAEAERILWASAAAWRWVTPPALPPVPILRP